MPVLTETEAKTRICPQITSGKPEQKCHASGCMMWRWAYDGNRELKVTVGGTAVQVGYCGLAGRAGPRRAGT